MDLKQFLSPLIKNIHNTVWILPIEVSVSAGCSYSTPLALHLTLQQALMFMKIPKIYTCFCAMATKIESFHIWPTLQRVENGEKVHEGHIDRAPREEGKAPGHAEQEGETDDTAKVTQHLLLKRAVVALSVPATDLHHHHNKHGHVQYEDDAKVGHACHVEHNLALNPAAKETWWDENHFTDASWFNHLYIIKKCMLMKCIHFWVKLTILRHFLLVHKTPFHRNFYQQPPQGLQLQLEALKKTANMIDTVVHTKWKYTIPFTIIY